MSNVTLNAGLVSVSVPGSVWTRMRAALRRPNPTERIHILPMQATIRLVREDEGEVEVGFWLVNMNRRRIIPERVLVRSMSWLSMVLPELPWVTRGLGTPINGRSVESLWMSVQLNTAAIRRIHMQSPKECWRLLGGGHNFNIAGSIDFVGIGRRKPFEMYFNTPALHAYWLLAADPASTPPN